MSKINNIKSSLDNLEKPSILVFYFNQNDSYTYTHTLQLFKMDVLNYNKSITKDQKELSRDRFLVSL